MSASISKARSSRKPFLFCLFTFQHRDIFHECAHCRCMNSSKAWETLPLVRVLCSCTLRIKQPMETSEIKLILIYNSDLFHERKSWHKENLLNKYISPLAKNPEKIFVFISDFSEVFFIIKIFVTTNDAICPFLVFFDTYLFGICTSI